MEVNFHDGDYKRLEADGTYLGQFTEPVVLAFRKRLHLIRSLHNEHDLLSLKSLQFTQLMGNRKHQHSLRLNDQSCLVVELVDEPSTRKKVMRVIGIEDSHSQLQGK